MQQRKLIGRGSKHRLGVVYWGVNYMNHITSAKNPIIKHLRKLATSGSYRTKTQQTLLDGVHVCESFVQSGGTILQLIISSSATDDQEVQTIMGALRRDKTEIVVVPDSLLASLSVVERGARVLGVIEIPTVRASGLTSTALLIDDVQDPGNMGTILRTAAAAGVSTIYTSAGTASAWAPKVLRAGMGAQFALTIHERIDLAQLIKDATVPVYATSLQADKTLYESNLVGEVAWLFGSEGSGVSAELLVLCGGNTLIIPQSQTVESLNVAAAVAVCLFEQRRQKIAHLG